MSVQRATLYGLMAKTPDGRQRLKYSVDSVIPCTFPKVISQWWFDLSEGFAMYSPRTASIANAMDGNAFSAVGRIRSRDDVDGALTIGDRSLVRNLSRGGAKVLTDVDGDFAIAFWNSKRSELMLARDRFGQRSIYIREDDDFFYYCTELQPLLADPKFKCQLDFESAYRYLAFGQPMLGRTLACGVSKIPAAHLAIWRPFRTLLFQKYYSPLRHDTQKVLDAAGRSKIVRALDRAIEKDRFSGRHALLLSGGVDSSYIASVRSKMRATPALEAYTIAFSGLDAANEGEFAKLVCNEYGLNHHIVELDPGNAQTCLEKVLTAPEPCSAWATITHHHLLSRIQSDGHTRLLSGLGADEVFGGYSAYLKYYRSLRRHRTRWSVSDLVDPTDGIMWNPSDSRRHLFPGVPRFFDDRSLKISLHPPFKSWNFSSQDIAFYRECRKEKHDSHLFELMVAHECRHRIPELLFADFEPVSRNAGVSTVYPFLNPEVVELAAALGASERFSLEGKRWKNKIALRQLVAGRIPSAILERRPVSYNAPFLSWMELRSFAEPVLTRLRKSHFWDIGLIRRSSLRRIESGVAQCFSNPHPRHLNCVNQLWIVLTLAAWYDLWVDGRSAEYPYFEMTKQSSK